MILSEARELLFDVVVPTIDSQANVDKFNRFLNLVQERYINSGKWLGMIKEVAIVSSGGYFTLPPRFVAALAVKEGTCGCPIQLASRWYAYRYGVGMAIKDANVWPIYGYSGAVDAGDGFVTFKDSPYTPYYLRFTRASADDAGTQILLKGRDESGNSIFTKSEPDSYEGMIVTLDNLIVTTTQKFSGRLEFLQKLRSHGYLYLDAVDPVSGAVTRIGYYAPSETTPSYHRYLNGCTTEDSWVAAICKIRYSPAVADSDEVIPSNAGALRAGLAALKCESEGDTVRRDQFLADGLRMLSDEARENRGGVRFALRIDPQAFQFGNLYQGG
jgi:hypothetical protein